MFQIVPCHIKELSWKFHENPFSRNIANRHVFHWKTTKRSLVSKGLNITQTKFSRLFLLPCPTYPDNFIIIRNVAYKHTNRQTYQQRWIHNLRRSAGVITLVLESKSFGIKTYKIIQFCCILFTNERGTVLFLWQFGDYIWLFEEIK